MAEEKDIYFFFRGQNLSRDISGEIKNAESDCGMGWAVAGLALIPSQVGPEAN